MQAVNKYVDIIVEPKKPKLCQHSSQFKGVTWDQRAKKWVAQVKGKGLGHHATEEAARQAYINYVEHGVDPIPRRNVPGETKRAGGEGDDRPSSKIVGGGLHSSTFQLNLSRFYHLTHSVYHIRRIYFELKRDRLLNLSRCCHLDHPLYHTSRAYVELERR